MIIALTSDKLPPSALYDAASTILQQRLSQIAGRRPGGGRRQLRARGAHRRQSRPSSSATDCRLENVRTAIAAQTANEAKGSFSDADGRWSISANDQLMKAADYRPTDRLLQQWRSPCGCPMSPSVEDSVQTVQLPGPRQRQAGGAAHHLPPARRQHHHHGGCDQGGAAAAAREHRSRPSS